MSDKTKIKIIGKKKVKSYTKSDCEKELMRLAETKTDTSIYADHIRKRLKEFKD